MKQIQYSKGQVDGWMIATIGLIVAFLAAGSLAIWAYMNYLDQKSNVDSRVDAKVAEARRDQSEIEQAKFLEEEKNPRREFAGPDDYGRLSFTYPKTWSLYVDKDPTSGASGRDYTAYFHPISVPSVSVRDQRFALRVSILSEDYDKHLQKYDRQIKDGKLRSRTVNVDGDESVRLDGNFSDEMRGSAIFFKIRDKTAVVQTDADTFRHDFDELIKTISFIR